MSSRYDDELWELVPADPGPPPTHLAEFVRALGPVDVALDLGCGDGRLSALLRARELTLADVSAVALARARARLPAARVVELEPDAPLPLPDAQLRARALRRDDRARARRAALPVRGPPRAAARAASWR